MYRGVVGQLMPVSWFQEQRRRQPDNLVYLTVGVGIVLGLLFGLLPGAAGLVLSLLILMALVFLLFAIGTRLAHQFIVYGIGVIGTALYLVAAVFSALAVLDLIGSGYASATMVLSSIVYTVGAAVLGAVLGYVGWQVHQGVHQMSGRGPSTSVTTASSATLLVRAGSQNYTFPPSRDVVIGRLSDADVQVHTDNKGAISRVHLVVQPKGGRWTAIDKSHNGIYVNGARLTEVPIQGEVRIHLGDPTGPPLDFITPRR